MNNYILCYSPLIASPSEGQIHSFVTVNRYIIQYYRPFSGTYLLKSTETPYKLNESVKGFFESNAYILTLYNPEFSGGSMPPEIWSWLNEGTIPTAFSSIAPPSFSTIADYGKLP